MAAPWPHSAFWPLNAKKRALRRCTAPLHCPATLRWTGLPIAFALVDWMIAFPMKADENGAILI